LHKRSAEAWVDAEKFGLEIGHLFLTHFHADVVAGHLELRDRSSATIRLGARARAEYAFVSMKDGDTLEFPGLRVQVVETPGHTIESISILVFDLEKDPAKPRAGAQILDVRDAAEHAQGHQGGDRLADRPANTSSFA
jgi:phosphoribosyl 1,2-cyclic phosphodiesterase